MFHTTLTRKEQKKLTKEICANVAASIIRDIENGKVPEQWDGIELRELIADRARWHHMDKKRARAYRNTVIVNGL